MTVLNIGIHLRFLVEKVMANIKQQSNLEIKFREALKEAHAKIDEKLKEADMKVQEAIKISEECGIPFSSCVEGMPMIRTFIPKSFRKKWKKLEDEEGKTYDSKLEDLADEFEFNIFSGKSGWEHWNMSSTSC